jgi:hypothetical protein
MKDIESIYSKEMQGGELPYFAGNQYGSGWLRNIARFAFPILKGLGGFAANAATDIVMQNKNVVPTLKEHAGQAANKLAECMASVGGGVKIKKRKRNSTNSINKRRRITIFNK